MMYQFFKSIIDEDRAPVVICDPDHKIIYMNPAAAENYKKHGGYELVGKSLLDCHNEKSCERINKVIEWFKSDSSHNRIHTFFNTKQNKDVYMIALRDEEGKLIGYYEKHEHRNRDDAEIYGEIL